MIETNDKRDSGTSVLAAWHDDDQFRYGTLYFVQLLFLLVFSSFLVSLYQSPVDEDLALGSVLKRFRLNR